LLRAYKFDRYKTKKKDADETPGSVAVSLAVATSPQPRGPLRRAIIS
jgi:hypothetical protein